MIVTLLFVVLLPLALAAEDPTTVCSPDQVSFYGYNIQTDVTSYVTIDYKQNLMGVVTGNLTTVNDIANGKSYVIDDKGSCQSSDLTPKNPYPQCLSANAVSFGNIYVGFGTNQLNATLWQFPYSIGAVNGVVKAAFPNEPNSITFPFLSRFVDDKGVLLSASFYVDVTANITQPALLKIPDPCPPKVIV
ncbi:uncharacterized protein LOC106075324 [Biomphalaria glabrata]|uniref:Uncharacterized protein LOC106075324 n=1 Tax=Biomphalaria glabrata TaxID=6526 RepID=A0A9W2YUJ0_BIOGL|nr:uncharacterized protein LOC106075324 [Biomphalaria glabrata]